MSFCVERHNQVIALLGELEQECLEGGPEAGAGGGQRGAEGAEGAGGGVGAGRGAGGIGTHKRQTTYIIIQALLVFFLLWPLFLSDRRCKRQVAEKVDPSIPQHAPLPVTLREPHSRTHMTPEHRPQPAVWTTTEWGRQRVTTGDNGALLPR